MEKLVSISGACSPEDGSANNRDRLVGAAVAKPALVNGSISSVNSAGKAIGVNEQSTSCALDAVDPDNALLETLLDPVYTGDCQSKINSSIGTANKPHNEKSRSSENLEMLLSDDFDDQQISTAMTATKPKNEILKERGHGDYLKMALEEPSESFGETDCRRSLASLNACSVESNVIEVAGILKNYRESKEATTAAKFEDPASESESDDEFYRKLRAPLKQNQQNEKKVHPNYAGHTVHNELTVTDMPEIEEIKDLNLEDDAYMEVIGHVMSVVGVLAVVKSANQSMSLNEESVLFNEDKSVFGKVFEVFGPVKEPFYSVRFNSEQEIDEKGIRVGLKVYCCLSDFELTKVVFRTDLDNNKGSDASWSNDCEPPAAVLDYSDDEKEREAKRQLQLERRARRGSENDPLQADEALIDSPDDSNDDDEAKAAKLERRLLRERERYNKAKGNGGQQKTCDGETKRAKVVRSNAMAFDQNVSGGDEASFRRGVKKRNRQSGAQKTNMPIDILYMQKLGNDKPKSSSHRSGNEGPTKAPVRKPSNPFDLQMRRNNDELSYRGDEFQFSKPFPAAPLNISNRTINQTAFEKNQSSSNLSSRPLDSAHGTSRSYTMPVSPGNFQGGFKPATFSFNSSLQNHYPRSSFQKSGDSLFRFQSGHRSSPSMPVAHQSISGPGCLGTPRFSFLGTNSRHESWIGLGQSQNYHN